MIKISKAKEIMGSLGFTHLVIFGISKDGKQHVATHGKTKRQAREAAEAGNNLKKRLGWPGNLCNSKPLEGICGNCSFWQSRYHAPGSAISNDVRGACMLKAESTNRFEKDIACLSFEPLY